MANQPQVNQTARSWNPNQSFSHAERERFVFFLVENETFMVASYEMIQYEKTVVLKFG